jgi:hypothetical protein
MGFMKISLRHKWALKVAQRYSKPAPALAGAPYMNFVTAVLLVAAAVVILIKSEGKFPQSLILSLIELFLFLSMFFVVIGLVMIERRAFSELLAAREEEIQKLRGNTPIERN